MKIIERIYNAETNETIDIEREMTAAEIAYHQKVQEELQKEEEKKQQLQTEKSALLQKLGITEQEAKLLLS
jgi:hypothetical protein